MSPPTAGKYHRECFKALITGRFAIFPQDQLELISKNPIYGGFELVTMPWKADLIASAIRDLTNPIDAIVIPNDFVRGSDLGVSGDLYYWLTVDFLSVRGKALILTGGISGEGRIKALLNSVFSITAEHSSTSTEDDAVVSKMHQIYDTTPYEKDQGVPPIFRPENMPKELNWPMAIHEDLQDGRLKLRCALPGTHTLPVVGTPLSLWYRSTTAGLSPHTAFGVRLYTNPRSSPCRVCMQNLDWCALGTRGSNTRGWLPNKSKCITLVCPGMTQYPILEAVRSLQTRFITGVMVVGRHLVPRKASKPLLNEQAPRRLNFRTSA
ncbi:uncharacterized protein LOC113146910 [Cyclospora cayetanensis]|uniref:Uncharacterized protein LOC113146910 n=1 Tax=Cyclospora cayetanensis TaxID=88456 RepID=A0A6P6RUD3_9EIME|nr:uncharacterized protein LOC113146910 [Cyclospora cayetanensis]